MQKINGKRLIALLALIGWLVLLLFSADLRAQGKTPENSSIKIGLLIPSESYVEAAYGARIAVEKVNQEGGVAGSEVELLIRHLDGPWGQGTKQVVDLVYKQKVMAILGAHRGRNAHLVEQVIAKTQVPFVSAWASDPTLSQAFVPWYFSCAPDSRSQAEALDQELLLHKGYKRLLLLSDGSYDANVDRNHFLELLKAKGISDYDSLDFDPKKLQDGVFPEKSYDGIVLFGEPATTHGIFAVLERKYKEVPVYGSFTMLGEGAFRLFEGKNMKALKVFGSGSWLAQGDGSWQQQFAEEFGYYPGAAAAYAHDGMELLLAAIKAAKGDRSQLLENISSVHYSGLTGKISFDDRGNRKGIPELLRLDEIEPSLK